MASIYVPISIIAGTAAAIAIFKKLIRNSKAVDCADHLDHCTSVLLNQENKNQ